MADTFTIDFSQIDTLAADLGDVAEGTGKRTGQAVEVSAVKVKKAWAEKLTGENGLPHAPRSITYDMTVDAVAGQSLIGAEVGAEQGRLQAPIVTVLEFGSPVNNTSPRGYGAGALQENEKDFIHGLELAMDPRL